VRSSSARSCQWRRAERLGVGSTHEKTWPLFYRRRIRTRATDGLVAGVTPRSLGARGGLGKREASGGVTSGRCGLGLWPRDGAASRRCGLGTAGGVTE
jgi:hypothetical protein